MAVPAVEEYVPWRVIGVLPVTMNQYQHVGVKKQFLTWGVLPRGPDCRLGSLRFKLLLENDVL